MDDLLDDIIEELLQLGPFGLANQQAAIQRGYYVRARVLRADGPARSMLKCIKGHSGYNACERCVTTGKVVVESSERLRQRLAQQSMGAAIAAAAARKFRKSALSKKTMATATTVQSKKATTKKATTKKGKKGKVCHISTNVM